MFKEHFFIWDILHFNILYEKLAFYLLRSRMFKEHKYRNALPGIGIFDIHYRSFMNRF